MKFLSFLLCVILALSFTVNSFATELESTLPESVPVVETEQNASSDNEYLDMVLNNMQNDISDLEVEVDEINDVLDTLSESNPVVDSPVEDVTVSEEETSEEEINPSVDIEDGTLTGINLMSVSPITPEDTSGLKAVLLSVIGDYDPVVVEYEYQSSNGYSNYLREILPDYPWFAGFLMLSLFVYCLFRLGGALIG